VAVSQAGHQAIRRALTHVAGRHDDALRVVVAKAEDRIGEFEPVAKIRSQRRQVDRFLDLEDRPVARIHFDLGVPGVDDARTDGLALVHQLDGGDLFGVGGAFLPEGDDAVLDGDEVAVAEVTGGAVAARTPIVVGVQLDETLAALADERQRQQTHLGLELALHVLREGRTPVVVGPHRVGRNGNAARPGGGRRLDLAELSYFSAQNGDLLLGIDSRASGEKTAEAEEQDRDS